MNKKGKDNNKTTDKQSDIDVYHRPQYTTVKQLNTLVDEYLDNCETNGKTPNKPGLALHLRFSGVRALKDWMKNHASLNSPLLRAKSVIESKFIDLLADHSNKNSNGPWRYLQSSYHYTERTKSDIDISGKIIRMPAKRVLGKALPKPRGRKKASDLATQK